MKKLFNIRIINSKNGIFAVVLIFISERAVHLYIEQKNCKKYGTYDYKTCWQTNIDAFTKILNELKIFNSIKIKFLCNKKDDLKFNAEYHLCR